MSPRTKADITRRVSPREMPELMDGDCSYEDFRECLRSLEQVNRLFFGYRPTLDWLERLPTGRFGPIHIVDVGSGGGDLLRRVARWARKRGIPVSLTGIDLNPLAARVAAELTPVDLNINWMTGDALAYQPVLPIDVAVSSLMAHHLEDDEVTRLLGWMEASTRTGWFINDLERSAWNGRLFGWAAKIAGWHRFVQHDGSVSFQRAFREADWERFLIAGRIPLEAVTVEHWRPGRLCLGRIK